MSGVKENIKKAFMVPGQPHLAFDTDGWRDLKAAMKKAGESALASNPDVYIIYSSQWISVLGHSFQADPNPKGYHVDENWYALGDFPFSFPVDTKLTEAAEKAAKNAGFATKLVNYEGFPIDTGTLVTLKYFNPENKVPVMIVSSNIYASPEDSFKLGEAIKSAIEASGKKAVFINCSSLSHRFFTEDINPAEDKLSSENDDEWNQKILELLKEGKNAEALKLSPDYVKAANPEMMFKGFHWLMGATGTPDKPAECHAYGPIWGTGAAVLEYSLN